MTPDTFRAALEELGWTQQQASIRLRVAAGKGRINDWAQGRAPVPPYIAASIEAHLELHRCRERAAT